MFSTTIVSSTEEGVCSRSGRSWKTRTVNMKTEGRAGAPNDLLLKKGYKLITQNTAAHQTNSIFILKSIIK